MESKVGRVFNVNPNYISNPENNEFISIYRNKLDNKYYGRRSDGVDEPLGGTNGDLFVRISLTANEIKNLFTSPKDLIASPGVNKAILVTNSMCRFNFGTIPFDDSNDNGISLIIDDSDRNQAYTGFVISESTVSSFFINQNISKENTNQLVGNKKLVAKADFDSVNGDSTIDLLIYYKIVDLTI
jgi:hypothetical protein